MKNKHKAWIIGASALLLGGSIVTAITVANLKTKNKKDSKQEVNESNDLKNRKEELAKMIELLPYPSMAASAKQELKILLDGITTSEEMNDFKKSLEEIDTQVSSLKEKISKLSEENHESLNNKLNEANTSEEFKNLTDEVEQKLFFEESKNFINSLNYLSNEEKIAFQEEIVNSKTKEEVELVKNKAKNQNDFKAKKESLKLLIDSFTYPGINKDKENETKEYFKSQVESTTLENIANKENEIKEYGNALKKKVEILKMVPYTIENAEGRVEIAKLINEAKSIKDLNILVPDTWVEHFTIYKKLIEDNFEGQQKTNLLNRFNISSARNIFQEYTINDLRHNIYLTYKNNALSWVENNISDQTLKEKHKEEIQALNRTDNADNPDKEASFNQFTESFNELKNKFESIKNTNAG
ncbi:hypothetical protein MCANPG14_00543 [Mycoplasmopsis canis PG 14]|uniref:Protein G-related albumin-binding (GA) module domain-containing protein n=1 Tax=Mycoplasmopsis canis TaxID=29555 RepID=A0A449AQ03_9BACT|nr:GA module-containing protein [Mycoplasmopsis canis]AMD81389.1 hypothetical protein AXW82_02415 [Mycoplasmopsis canis PG 14]EIE40865.1 hypothetical protein MCANPG14_00543 [Mycoplasmopsis canis PG 14]VEU68628.1 Uncharacterised protein [Mycoplasmopsis canis]